MAARRGWDPFLLPLLILSGLLLLTLDQSQSFVSNDAHASLQRFQAKDLALPGFLDRANRTDLSKSISYLPQVTGIAGLAWGGRTPALDFKRNEFASTLRIESENTLDSQKRERSSSNQSISAGDVRITSRFGFRRLDGVFRHHDGIDIALPHGAPIRAHSAGVVSFSGWRQGYGYTVIVDHGDGVETLYAHASSLCVTPGQKVEKGAMIARVGNTGRSYGTHLHFEIRHFGVPIDPEDEYLAARRTSSGAV